MLGSEAGALSTAVVTFGMATAAFACTNLDNLAALSGAFVDNRFSPRCVVLGFGIGSSAVLALSVFAALLTLVIDASYTRLLGVVPLGMGLLGIWRLRQGAGPRDRQTCATPPRRGSPLGRAIHGRATQLLTVAATTVACGGDNVVVYAPLLARRPQLAPWNLAILVLLNASLCLLCYHVSSAVALKRWGSVIGSVTLIVVAITILAGGRGGGAHAHGAGGEPLRAQATSVTGPPPYRAARSVQVGLAGPCGVYGCNAPDLLFPEPATPGRPMPGRH